MRSRFILNLLAIFLLVLGLIIGLLGWQHAQQNAQSSVSSSSSAPNQDSSLIRDGQVLSSALGLIWRVVLWP